MTATFLVKVASSKLYDSPVQSTNNIYSLVPSWQRKKLRLRSLLLRSDILEGCCFKELLKEPLNFNAT